MTEAVEVGYSARYRKLEEHYTYDDKVHYQRTAEGEEQEESDKQ